MLLASASPGRSPSCSVSRAGVTCRAFDGGLSSCPCDSHPPESETGPLPRGSQGRVSRGQQRKPQDSPRHSFWAGVTRLHSLMVSSPLWEPRAVPDSGGGKQMPLLDGRATRPHDKGTGMPQGGSESLFCNPLRACGQLCLQVLFRSPDRPLRTEPWGLRHLTLRGHLSPWDTL